MLNDCVTAGAGGLIVPILGPVTVRGCWPRFRIYSGDRVLTCFVEY